MKGPDAIFGSIKYYLSRPDIAKSDKILFVADGARWIWNRVPELVKEFGIAAEHFYTFIMRWSI
jgi:hypothetical protein